MKKLALIQLKLSETLLLQAVLEKINNNTVIFLDKTPTLSSLYEELFFSIINGEYSITYVDDGVVKTDTFDFGCPFKNMSEYISVFKDLPITFSIIEQDVCDSIQKEDLFNDFPFSEKETVSIEYISKESL